MLSGAVTVRRAPMSVPMSQSPDHPIEPTFVVGHEYTRDEIHAGLGGSKVSCLPTQHGRIVAACLTTEFSPAAPRVVLCGQGPRTGRVSKLLTLERGRIPVFIKQAAGRWKFHGVFEVSESFSRGARFESFVAGSGRSLSSVSHVVLLSPSR